MSDAQEPIVIKFGYSRDNGEHFTVLAQKQWDNYTSANDVVLGLEAWFKRLCSYLSKPEGTHFCVRADTPAVQRNVETPPDVELF